jgi:ABC-2 type transport system permease protein
MFAIYKKEINAFFNSLIGYLVIVVFLSFIGLYMWVFPDYNVFDLGFADMETLFTFGPLAFLFLIPAITMRSFAEEKKDGTIELLLTRPVTDWQIISGKYLACLTLVVFSLLPTMVYYGSLYFLGNPVGNIDSAGVFSSYLGLILLGSVFTAVGLFCSAISGNQIVAFIFSVILIYFLYDGISRIAVLGIFQGMALFFTSFGLDFHYYSMGKGLIDSRNVLYFVSCILVLLMSTKLVMGSRQWE